MIKKSKQHKKTKSKHTQKNVLLENILNVANNVTMRDLLNNSLFKKTQKHTETSNKGKTKQRK